MAEAATFSTSDAWEILPILATDKNIFRVIRLYFMLPHQLAAK